MRTLRVVVKGDPVPKARARTVRSKGGKVHSYTPAKTKQWERMARIEAAKQIAGEKPIAGPIELSIVAYIAIPQSWPIWKQDAAEDDELLPTGKPDIDNIVKAVKDAMNGIMWKDDSQVVVCTAHKLYGTVPMVTIEAQRAELCAPSNVDTKADFIEWMSGLVE